MTEINIEKRSNRYWPWVIGVILVLLIAVGAFLMFADERTREQVLGEEETRIEEPRETPPGQVPPPRND